MNNLYSAVFRAIDRYRFFVLGFWLLTLAFSIWIGPRFFGSTSNAFTAPSGTLAYTAHQYMNREFPKGQNQGTLVVLIRNLRNESCVDDPNGFAAKTTRLLQQSTASFDGGLIFKDIQGYFLSVNSTLDFLKSQFTTPDHTSTFIVLTYFHKVSASSIVAFVRSQVTEALSWPEAVGYSAGVTGVDALFADVITGTTDDMFHIDVFILPLAMVILCLYLKSVRIMLVPAFTLPTSIFFSFLVMYPIAAKALAVVSFAPSILLSLILAMSIDYALFLLTRYREEVLAAAGVQPGDDPPVWIEDDELQDTLAYGMSHSALDSIDPDAPLNPPARRRCFITRSKHAEAVKRTVLYAGRVVFTSGVTLAISFLALVFFPIDFLRSIGVSACVALTCTILVNLTLTPALLLAFGKFFSNFRPLCACRPSSWRTRCAPRPLCLSLAELVISCTSRCVPAMLWTCDDRHPDAASDEGDSAAYAPDPVPHSPESPAHDEAESAGPRKSCCNPRAFWVSSAKRSTSTYWSVGIVIVVVAVSVPIGVQTLKMDSTVDNRLLFPLHSASLEVYNDLRQTYSPGLLSPFKVIVSTNGATGLVRSEEYFNVMTGLVNAITAEGLVPLSGITGITYIGALGFEVQWPLASALLNESSPLYNTSMGAGYRMVWGQQVSHDASSALLSMNVGFDPMGDESPDWLDKMRQVISVYTASLPKTSQYTMLVTGASTDECDCVSRINEIFPYLILGTSLFVISFVGIVFRSLFVPFRLLLTITLPLSLTNGMAVLIFDNGIFDRAFPSIHPPGYVHAIYWLVPIMSFSILVGLALDYDIFLFSRIVEFRRAGYSDRDSIIQGLVKTGSIITAAGLIMTVAFGGLLLSSSQLLVQFGFMLCFAVLLDTFIVRTTLVPAILHLAGLRGINWWPSKMPTVSKPGEYTNDALAINTDQGHASPEHALDDSPLIQERARSRSSSLGHGYTPVV